MQKGRNVPADDLQGAEIAELLNEVKQRVRSRYPSASVPVERVGAAPIRVPLANLMPLVHARDAAQAKIAAIGSVNPRAGGLANKLIQFFKRAIARSLGWFVRDQVTFNRQTIACVEAAMEAMNELNSSISILAGEFNERISQWNITMDELRRETAQFKEEAAELNDVRAHWQGWHVQWEKAIAANELQFLRGVADLQTGFSHRANQMESNFRDMVKAQHDDYLGALDRTDLAIQKKLWADMDKIRLEYDRLIHTELRLIRQRMPAPPVAVVPVPVSVAPLSSGLGFDYGRFAERFRGSEAYVRANQRFYVPYMEEAGSALDLGCGRGEFLELLRERGIRARGIESSAESVTYCLSKGLEVEEADLFEYLANLPEQSEDAIFASQVVEHLDPARIPELVRLCASRLRKGGLLVFETPNPECLAIFATHFYLDPTHQRPIPSALLSFYMEEAGLGKVEVHRFSPAKESFPEIELLPEAFAERFFGGLDYGILGFKL
jgi:O-antigen chain-terminating methyltransferase